MSFTWQDAARWARVLVGVVCASLAFLTVVSAAARTPRRPRTAPTPAGPGASSASAAALPAKLTFTGTGRRIPPQFFGLSIEYKELLAYERTGPLFDRALALVRPRVSVPMLLRIGGKSADHVWWQTATRTPPPWVTKLGGDWLTGLSELVRRDRLAVILDLNLAVHSAVMAESFVAAAHKALPPGSLSGVEVGNEPDFYYRQPSLDRQRLPSTFHGVPQKWTARYSPSEYRQDFLRYARAIAGGVPGIALGALDIIMYKPQWLAAVTGLGRLGPRFIAIHRYASSTCFPRTSPYYPTVPLMLSESSSAGLAGSIAAAATFAHAHGMALRLTEVNSISCGGNHGVADSFATALWAPDALFEMIRTGVDGVSWHIRPETLNAPFRLTVEPPHQPYDLGATTIEPLPELYGLAMFAQMIGGHPTLLSSTLNVPSALHLKAWGVRNGATTTVLLIDKGTRAARVSIPSAKAGAAVIRRLQAPGIGSVTGTRYAGRWIGPDARWHGSERVTRIRPAAGAYDVTVPGYSAATVTFGS